MLNNNSRDLLKRAHFIKGARRFRKRFTALGASRALLLGWCQAAVEDLDCLLQAIEKDNVKEEIGPNTARLLRLWNESFLQNVVHEAFPRMKDYGESLNPSPEKEEEEIEAEAEIEGEPFTIKKKRKNQDLSPVGDYFTNG